MTEIKRTKRQTLICKALHRILNIAEHESNKQTKKKKKKKKQGLGIGVTLVTNTLGERIRLRLRLTEHIRGHL